jgi:signal transduction histidine kinase
MKEVKPVRLLYMEDDPGIATLTRKALEQEGIALEIVMDGASGLDLLKENEYDIIMVDYRMPGMNGMEVLEELKKEGEHLPVIMVTGGGSEKTAVQAMKLGASDYIVKDIEAGYLELVPLVIEQVMKRHRLQIEKREAEEAKEQLIKELDAFAYTVAHDLKTPLYSVQINMDRFKKIRELPAEEGDKMVKGMEVMLAKMNNIIEELFVLSTVRSQEVDFAILNMNEIVDEALQRMGFLINERKPEIIIQDNFPNALGHAPWVEEVLANYISNAIKYGGNPPKIEIGATREPGEYVKFWVKDNGKGISEAQQQKLFVPFTRLDTLKAEGHGLGLSIVERIMLKLDGHTGVESELGKGSIFSFYLLKA